MDLYVSATKDENLSTEKVDELLSDDAVHFIFVNVNYESTKHDHWVGINGATKIDDKDFYIISPTSMNDSAVGPENLRGIQGWKKDSDGNILVPVSETKGYVDFSSKKPDGDKQ